MNDLSQVKGPYNTDKAQLVVFAASIVGIGHITVQTVELFIVRMLMYSKLITALPITPEDIRAFIGLSTDVDYIPDDLWLCRLQRVFWEHLEMIPLPSLYRNPGDVILAAGGMPNQWKHSYLVPPEIVAAADVTDMPFARMYIVYRNLTGTNFVVAETDERLFRELTVEECEAFHRTGYFFEDAQAFHKKKDDEQVRRYNK